MLAGFEKSRKNSFETRRSVPLSRCSAKTRSFLWVEQFNANDKGALLGSDCSAESSNGLRRRGRT